MFFLSLFLYFLVIVFVKTLFPLLHLNVVIICFLIAIFSQVEYPGSVSKLESAITMMIWNMENISLLCDCTAREFRFTFHDDLLEVTLILGGL